MEQSLSWEANWFSSSQEIPRIFGTRRFITAFTSARHLSLSWARSIQSMTSTFHFLKTNLNIIPLSMPCSSKQFLSLRSTTPNLYVHIRFPIRATCLANLNLLDLITWIVFGEQYRLLSSSLCSFLRSTVTPSLLGSNIPLTNLFSSTHNFFFSLNVKNQVSHPYKTTRKIIVLVIENLYFWTVNWKKKYSAPNDSLHFLNLICF